MPLRLYASALLGFLLFLNALPAVAQKPPVRIKAEGKVLAVSPGIIQMHDAKQGNLQVKIPTDRKVVAVTGKMKASALQPGMIVRFTGKLMGLTLAEPVTALTVYRPLEGYLPSVLADDPEAVVITGPVVSNKGGKLVVNAGRRITATIPDEAVATIETGDYTIAQSGDPIVVSGYKASNGIVTARDVKITLTVPEDKRPPASATPKKK